LNFGDRSTAQEALSGAAASIVTYENIETISASYLNTTIFIGKSIEMNNSDFF
jgi:hypothetical protein